MAEFKLIVAGGRDFTDYELMSRHLFKLSNGDLAHSEISIVSGMAPGADTLALEFAQQHEVEVYSFYADWQNHPRSGGMIRNRQMAIFADGLLAFWDQKSRGTKNMIETMRQKGKPVYVIYY